MTFRRSMRLLLAIAALTVTALPFTAARAEPCNKIGLVSGRNNAGVATVADPGLAGCAVENGPDTDYVMPGSSVLTVRYYDTERPAGGFLTWAGARDCIPTDKVACSPESACKDGHCILQFTPVNTLGTISYQSGLIVPKNATASVNGGDVVITVCMTLIEHEEGEDELADCSSRTYHTIR